MLVPILRSASLLRLMCLTIGMRAVACAFGQSAPAPKSPDEAWAEIVAFTKQTPASKIRTGTGKPPAELKARIRQQTDRAQQASQLARNFYMFNPGHPKAGEARKIEALYAVRAAADGDPAQEKLGVSIATAYRDNKSLAADDRFDVALALARFQHSQKIKAETAADSTASWLTLGESLQKEFGDVTALDAYRLELARRADHATAVSIATNIIKSPVASAAVRAEARSILDRAAMLGKPLHAKVPKIGGGEIDLSLQRNKVTAIVVWAPSDPAMLEPLKAFPHGLPEGVQIIYLAIGKVSDVLNAQGTQPVRGVNCYTPGRGPGKALGHALKLRYAPAPCVYVLDRSGNVAAIGRLTELPVLLQKTLG